MVSRRSWIGAALSATGFLALGNVPVAAARKPEIRIYRRHYTPCCTAWMQEMKADGFAVLEVAVNDLDAVKKDYAIPVALIACHTAVCEGYIIEGHVPAGAVHRLLRERPLIHGLAVAGTPARNETRAFTVVSWDNAGTIKPFGS